MRSAGNDPPSVRDYRDMECEVAREALSARLDGEVEPVPGTRVDEHLAQCAECRQWERAALLLSGQLRAPSLRPVVDRAPRPRHAALGIGWIRWALMAVGGLQVVVAAAQAAGLDMGLARAHGMVMGGHLLNESTAWSVALGLVMVAAGIRPAAALGLAGVLATFACVLVGYAVVDVAAGDVTVARLLTHVPVLLGGVLAVLVWRRSARPAPNPLGEQSRHSRQPDDEQIILPPNASRGKRRGHLWPTDGAA
jgi:predicted anti-sigma-YlaC factor YlaD